VTDPACSWNKEALSGPDIVAGSLTTSESCVLSERLLWQQVGARPEMVDV
jgi:hypothetical protein